MLGPSSRHPQVQKLPFSAPARPDVIRSFTRLNGLQPQPADPTRCVFESAPADCGRSLKPFMSCDWSA
jgi:hypothetical protein